MELEPRLVAQNRHVRDFAAKNRLRFVRLPDGELVLPLGPRKRAASPTNHLGTHASYVGSGEWVVFALTNRPGLYAQTFRDHGAYVLELDGELSARLPEANLLPALDASPQSLRTWRRRVMSDAERQMRVESLAAINARRRAF